MKIQDLQNSDFNFIKHVAYLCTYTI